MESLGARHSLENRRQHRFIQCGVKFRAGAACLDAAALGVSYSCLSSHFFPVSPLCLRLSLFLDKNSKHLIQDPQKSRLNSIISSKILSPNEGLTFLTYVEFGTPSSLLNLCCWVRDLAHNKYLKHSLRELERQLSGKSTYQQPKFRFPGPLGKARCVVNTCNPSTPKQRWETETGESPGSSWASWCDICGAVATSKLRPCLKNRVEGENQLPSCLLPSQLRHGPHAPAFPYTHKTYVHTYHIYTHRHT